MAQEKDNRIITVCHPICCGLDVHKDMISACLVSVDESGEDYTEIREFRSFTADLQCLRDWLVEKSCPIVAMESTGVYWRPVYNVLEDVVQVILVNARHIKNLPGKKTDIADSKWLAGLLRHGLLRGSFIPPEFVRDWRDLTRMRKGMQAHLADYKRRIHKLFESANIKLGSVLSDIFGATGQRLMHLLMARSTDITLEDIEACMQGPVKSNSHDVLQAIKGFFREHHRYMLEKYLRMIASLEKELADLDQRLTTLMESYHSHLHRLEAIPGISMTSAKLILSEIGPTLDQFSTSAALASWCGLCPGNNQSAGKRRSGRSPVRRHRLKEIMIEVAWAAIRKKGSYYKEKFYRLRSRLGPTKALVAVAHRLLKAIYHVIKYQEEFRDLGENYLLMRHQSRKIAYLKRQAKVLGYELIPVTA
jgi:transposase